MVRAASQGFCIPKLVNTAAGEAPCIATYWVRSYWQLLVLRLLTGISLGGILPLILSLLGDLFSGEHRSAVAALVQVATGLGMAVGQMIAGFVGERSAAPLRTGSCYRS